MLHILKKKGKDQQLRVNTLHLFKLINMASAALLIVNPNINCNCNSRMWKLKF